MHRLFYLRYFWKEEQRYFDCARGCFIWKTTVAVSFPGDRQRTTLDNRKKKPDRFRFSKSFKRKPPGYKQTTEGGNEVHLFDAVEMTSRILVKMKQPRSGRREPAMGDREQGHWKVEDGPRCWPSPPERRKIFHHFAKGQRSHELSQG